MFESFCLEQFIWRRHNLGFEIDGPFWENTCWRVKIVVIVKFKLSTDPFGKIVKKILSLWSLSFLIDFFLLSLPSLLIQLQWLSKYVHIDLNARLLHVITYFVRYTPTLLERNECVCFSFSAVYIYLKNLSCHDKSGQFIKLLNFLSFFSKIKKNLI